ncbi:MAG: TolC family protein [Verrucomicrobiaceae bacterium]|nr:TolC family protein [Verrucomicrobiaceae bacterium]
MRKDDTAGVSSHERCGEERRKRRDGRIPVLLSALALGALSSCSPQLYEARADREVYSVLTEKTPGVDNVEPNDIHLTETPLIDLDKFKSTGGNENDFLGDYARQERGAKQLSLDDAVGTAIVHGRSYLNAREQLFLSALDLTLARHRLAPIFRTDGQGIRATDSRQAQLQAGMTELVSTNTFSHTRSTGFNWLYKTGARISADFTQDFLRIMTGNRSLNESDVAVSVVQPLLQGGGTAVTLEALTQEERNLLYDLRDFADFRRGFVVEIVSDYYGVLRARDRVYNNYIAYRGFVKNVEREDALADENRRTQNQLARLRQAMLQSESRWIDAIRVYQSALDELKIKIGVPVDSKVVLDERELDRLTIEEPRITKEQSIEIAMVSRPDLITANDLVDDAVRQIKVAKNGLLPGLDLSLDYNSVSDPGDTTPAINWDRRRWSSSVDLDLPIDRKAERNIYRATLVQLDRAKRTRDLTYDRARLELYDSWRTLEQEKRNFRIAEEGVALAARRLEEQILLAELGRGEARDLVDAQEDLVDAQNQRTATVVNHTLARLRLWRDMGILYINNDGSWVEKLERESL